MRRVRLSRLTAALVVGLAFFVPDHANISTTSAAGTTTSMIEQQIDIQDVALTTTSTSYSDAAGSGSFLWNAARYSGLQHVYFEAGIGRNGVPHTTVRVRSSDILSSLVSGTTYKVRVAYGCAYSSSTNTFTETGYAELWSSDNSVEVTSSAVSNAVNTGTSTCPTVPTSVAVRFSRLIILQSSPTSLTDTNTTINLGHNETNKLADTNAHPLRFPKIWSYTDHNLHPTAGWDAIQDTLFSATLASPRGVLVSACLYDITSNSQITCVSTASTTGVYVSSGDITPSLHDGDQYETYLSTSSNNTPVTLYNAFVTVEQSSAAGIGYVQLYDDLNPYPVTSKSTTYSRMYFQNLWEPVNFNLQTGNIVPSTNEVVAFHLQATEEASSGATASTMLYNTCTPTSCTAGTVYNSNTDTTGTTWTLVTTPDNAFPMLPSNEVDAATGTAGTAGSLTSDAAWIVLNVSFITTYAVQENQGIAYGPEPSEVLDECLPIGAPSGQPGLIVIHGGSWSSASRTNAQFEDLCNAYAEEGYAVYDIDYRLTSGGYMWPDQIGDIQLAVRFMRSNAPQIGVDPNRICSYGWSTGSHLSLLLDEVQTIHAADVASNLSNYSPATDCVADFFGPTDLPKLYTESPAEDSPLQALLDNQTPSSDPAIYADASPVDNVTPQTGPTLIIQGTQDSTVKPDESQELQADLEAADIPYNFLWYVGGHGFYGVAQAQANMIREQADAWLVGQEHP